MKDKLGNVLEVGDTVAFLQRFNNNTNALFTGKVTGFTDKRVKVENGGTVGNREPHNLIKVYMPS